MKKGAILILAAIILLVVAVGGSLYFGFKKYSDKQNIVGVIAPRTGSQARNAEAMIRGFELAVEKDSVFRLIIEDSKDNPVIAKNAVLKLSGQRVKAILGDSRSAITQVAAEEASKQEIIMFSSISTSDNLTKIKTFFRNVPRNELQVEAARNLIVRHLKLDNVAIFNKNDEYGSNMSKKFQQIAEPELNIVFNQSYQEGTTDFRTQIEKIKNSGANVIFTPSNYEETRNFIKQAIEMNLQIPIIGGDDTDEELVNVAKEYEGGYYYTTFMYDKDNDFYRDFYRKFKEKYNIEPQTYDAYAYEAAMILLEAIRNTDKTTNEIKKYLISTEFNSLTGKISFSKEGEVLGRSFGIFSVKDNNLFQP